MTRPGKWRRGRSKPDTEVSGPAALPPFMSFVDAWNRLQGLETPALHATIARWLEVESSEGARRLLLLVFRDAGKSTLAGLFSAWLLLACPDTRILVLAADHELARKMVRTVRRIIERHPACLSLLPVRGRTSARKPKAASASRESWTIDQFTVRRDSVLRDPSMQARGIGSNITGSRADVVICDDVEVPNTVATNEKRNDLRARLGEIEFVLRPGGLQLYIGTPHTYYSIYADEARREAGEERPFLDGFSRLVLPIVDAAGRPAWPERFNDERIEALRLRSGPARFTSQMLLQPVNSRDARLDPDLIRFYDEETQYAEAAGQPRLLLGGRVMQDVRCWWDPSFGAPDRGDGSAIAAVFLDADGRFHIHDVAYVTHARQGALDEATAMCRDVVRFIERHNILAIQVENNGLARFLPGILRRELALSGNAAAVVESASSEPKDRRIMRAFDGPLAAGMVLAHRRLMSSRFLTEMREWQPGGRGPDDGLDAVACAMLAGPLRLPRAKPPVGRSDWRLSAGPFVARSEFNPWTS